MIFLIWTKPKKGLAKKRILQRDAYEGETYYEAIPTTAILTFIIIYTALQGSKNKEKESPLFALIGSDLTFFWVTYASSLLTASFGLSKALKTGPCRIFPEGGMFSCRFFLLVCNNLVTLLGKLNIFWAHPMAVAQDARGGKGTEGGLENSNMFIFFVPALTVLLPGLITALVSTWHSKMLKTFLNHPSFFILPIFTCFTFSSSKKTCCTRCGGAEGHIRFSVKASLCNLFASFLASVANAVYSFHVFSELSLIVRFLTAFSFPGLLLSLLFLCNVGPTNDRFICCCSCCSCKAAIEYGIYKPDHPTKLFILRIDADGSEVVLPADDQEKQADEEKGELKELLKEQKQDWKQETEEEESEELVDEELGQEKVQGTEEEQEEEEVAGKEELGQGQVELMEEGNL